MEIYKVTIASGVKRCLFPAVLFVFPVLVYDYKSNQLEVINAR